MSVRLVYNPIDFRYTESQKIFVRSLQIPACLLPLISNLFFIPQTSNLTRNGSIWTGILSTDDEFSNALIITNSSLALIDCYVKPKTSIEKTQVQMMFHRTHGLRVAWLVAAIAVAVGVFIHLSIAQATMIGSVLIGLTVLTNSWISINNSRITFEKLFLTQFFPDRAKKLLFQNREEILQPEICESRKLAIALHLIWYLSLFLAISETTVIAIEGYHGASHAERKSYGFLAASLITFIGVFPRTSSIANLLKQCTVHAYNIMNGKAGLFSEKSQLTLPLNISLIALLATLLIFRWDPFIKASYVESKLLSTVYYLAAVADVLLVMKVALKLIDDVGTQYVKAFSNYHIKQKLEKILAVERQKKILEKCNLEALLWLYYAKYPEVVIYAPFFKNHPVRSIKFGKHPKDLDMDELKFVLQNCYKVLCNPI